MSTRLRPRRAVPLAAAMVAALVMCAAAPARADDEPALPAPGWSYLVDDGAVPFIYAPLVLSIALRLFVEPPDKPRLFSEDEGGAPFDGDTVSDVALGAYGFAGLGLMAIVPSEGRWHHLKGYAKATMTTMALTEIAKNTFGRHRPHYTGTGGDDERRSFFSGHSSMTFATSTYLMLYLNRHVFERWRRPGQAFAWWETAPYAALLGGSLWVVNTRLDDNRHHKSDVMTGTLVGTATAGFFFWWQERGFRDAKAQLIVTPRQVGLQARF